MTRLPRWCCLHLKGEANAHKKGDTVGCYGEYEWIAQGGVIHGTHHDPSGRHLNGWLKYNGKTDQQVSYRITMEGCRLKRQKT
jgi:hypothetical protein